MRKGQISKLAAGLNPQKKNEVIAPATPPMSIKNGDIKKEDHKMDIEEPKDQATVNIEEVLTDNKKQVNLDETKKDKKHKKKDEEDDQVLRDITLAGDIHIRLVSNMNGYFVDLRKFFRGYPSQKGIRMAATKFLIASEYIKQDVDALGLQYPSSLPFKAATP